MSTLIIISIVLNTIVAAWTVRRLMGVPVGWPRTFLLSFIASLVAKPFAGVPARPPRHFCSLPSDTAGMGTAVAVLIVGWVIAIEISVLVVTEILVPTGQLPGPVNFMRGLPTWFRRMRRFVKIFGIAMKHGLIRYLNLPRISAEYTGTHEPATALREALTDGGVTFVKVG